jgi:hypothetical protein
LRKEDKEEREVEKANMELLGCCHKEERGEQGINSLANAGAKKQMKSLFFVREGARCKRTSTPVGYGAHTYICISYTLSTFLILQPADTQ